MARGSRPIWLRLTLTYVGVALLAVLILAAITAVFSERYVNVLVNERRDDLTRSLLVDAASTYNTGQPGWSDVDLRPALDLAARSGTDVAVVDNDGAVVAATFTDPRHAPDTQHEPILVRGQQVGALYVKFNGRGLVESADNLRRSLLHADVAAAGVAAVLALIAAAIVARRLSAPVRSLTAAAGAMSRGNRQVRVGELVRAPAELNELATTFDRMAATLSREEQLRRDLVADVAHELRTPVAVLQANCEALLDGLVPHTPAQTASLHEEVLRLAGMVDDLQTLASAEAAALHLVRESCDLATVAEMATDAMQVKANAAGVHLTRDFTPSVIEGDPTRLHQIVTNLLSNAVKFTPAGGTVHVNVTRNTKTARLVVADTGKGIAADQLPHVFERFWRGQQATEATEATEGTGIGLSIVAELVAAHDGDVSVDSHPGEGTTVTVTFPLSSVAG
jgi:two-component system, OmpR family, sensor histidine kinase BaeS